MRIRLTVLCFLCACLVLWSPDAVGQSSWKACLFQLLPKVSQPKPGLAKLPMGSAALRQLRAVDASSLAHTTESIRRRIEEMAGHHFVKWCNDAGLSYPPSFVVLKIYKEEAELEIWGGASGAELKRIIGFPICAMDFEPGPKLREGDGRTPEGRYALDIYGKSRHWFMWMALTPDAIDAPGQVGMGSAFRLCTDYPRADDIDRSKSIGIQTPGSAICIHGNCYSLGCPSLSNRDFAAVFAFVSQHEVEVHGKPMVEMYPFRLTDKRDLKAEAQRAAKRHVEMEKLGAAQIEAAWRALFQSEF